MKRKFRLFSSTLAFSSLFPSCVVNHCTNYIVPGHFEGTDAEDETRRFSLDILPIDEGDLLAAEGLNVVSDTVREGMHYSLDFREILPDGSTIRYDFIGLEDAYNSKGTPAAYRDSQKNWLCPMGTDSLDINRKGSSFYSIDYEADGIDVYVYFKNV